MNAATPDGRPSISFAVIARDEEQMIGACLDSGAWADERLVVLDAATTDRTAEVARQHGARVTEHTFVNFATQREHALRDATAEWVLFVDADERVGPELQQAVQQAVCRPSACVGYWIPRDNYILGQLVRTMGWYPDYQLRLMRRAGARFDPNRPVHEVPILDGPVGHLSAPFVHYNYRSLSEFLRKQERYCRLEASHWLLTYGRPRVRSLLGQPVREFYRRYVQLHGYRDGWRGLALSVVLAWYAGKAVLLARQSTTAPAAR